MATSRPVDPQALLASLLGEANLARLGNGLISVADCKQYLQSSQALLDQRFVEGEDIARLIRGRAALIDAFIQKLWQQQPWDERQDLCIVAVGGYGRGELHPHSDIDLLFLHKKRLNANNKGVLETFVTFLWDCGLEIGHSVRTPAECLALAKEDITVLTNLIESRPLFGDTTLYETVMDKSSSERMWAPDQFFLAKREEQHQRHKRTNNNEYNLEPNIKTSPGGLRDIQTICWITLRCFNEGDISALAARGVLTEIEAQRFIEGMHFLWRARYAMHMISGRHEDRLLFEFQLKVAELFGFVDDNSNLAVEKFMHEYYRRVLLLAELNDVLIQFFDLELVKKNEPEEYIELNKNFCVRNGYIDVVDEQVFERDLAALMEIFVLMGEHSYIRGVRASTIRLMRTFRENIDEEFCAEPKVKKLFMRLLRSGWNVPLQLKRMRQHGILSKYLPAFGDIIGQMQFDLFHIYTVDIHTLEVIQNVHKFAHESSEYDYLLSAKILNGELQIELLYLAALFHDIAKGRGGDHSELGSRDAREFCQRHGLQDHETNLVVWMVEKHLIMSSFSQKQDLSDPDVIRHFAREISDRRRLDYLYVLTVADINGTNPELWNAWRASLLRQLYVATARALRRGLEEQVDKAEIIVSKQAEALSQLVEMGVDEDKVKAFWEPRVEEYFLRESIGDLVLHAQQVVENESNELPLIIIQPTSFFDEEVITQITIYNKLVENRFTSLTLAMEELNLSVHDARLQIAGDGYVIDTFYVLDASDNGPLDHHSARIDRIRNRLRKVLEQTSDEVLSRSARTVSRRMRSFSWPSQTVFSNDYAPGFSVLEVIAPDRPGFLAIVGQWLFDNKLRLHSAKIATLGERVEDVFFLTDRSDRIIEDSEKIEEIQRSLREALDENTQALDEH